MDIMEGAHAGAPGSPRQFAKIAEEVLQYQALSPEKLAQKLKQLEQQMYKHARDLEFEEAAQVRDEIKRIQDISTGSYLT